MPVKKILIVDDELKVVKALRDHFENAGFLVSTASNGSECLDMVKSVHPDIILLDIIMPVMDGIETLKQMKADPNLASIPVIVLTNLDTSDGVANAIKTGSTHYLVKVNYDANAILAKVNEILSK